MVKKTIQHFSSNELSDLLKCKYSCVTLRSTEYKFALFPYHLSNLNASIKEILNGSISKYDKTLGGILLGYNNIKNLTTLGSIMTDSCHIYVRIEADFYVFKPEIGSMLKGVVNKKSKDHVGCLVNRVFNVSVPRDKNVIESDQDLSSWLGYQVNISDEVLLRVLEINIDARLPYIRAALISIESQNELLTKKKKKKSRNVKSVEEVEELNSFHSENVNEEETNLKKKKKHKKSKMDDSLVEKEDSQRMDEPEMRKVKKKRKKEKKYNEECLEESVEKFERFDEVLCNGEEKSIKKHKHKKKLKNEINTDQEFDNESTLLINEDKNEFDNSKSKKHKDKKKNKSEDKTSEDYSHLLIDSLLKEEYNKLQYLSTKSKSKKKSIIEDDDNNNNNNNKKKKKKKRNRSSCTESEEQSVIEINESVVTEKKHKSRKKNKE